MKEQNKENKICNIQELQKVESYENGDALIDLESKHPGILCNFKRKDAYVSRVLVRESVAEKLQRVQRKLEQYDPSLRICVVEGYRNPIYQESYFLKELIASYKNDPSRSYQDLLDHVHKLVALPSVAGHPTGGAVDVTLVCGDKEMDMGGEIADFSNLKKLPTFSLAITPIQSKNRMLLHDLMIGESFAPFYGEWWHFSYGDREWAAFYKLSHTLYSTIW